MTAASETQVGGDHYKTMAIQPVEFCQKNKLPFCESAVIKYVCRHGEKGGAEDINKAIHFLRLLLELDYSAEAHPSTSTMNLYQFAASKTATYPVIGSPIVYPALGLAGEAGEVVEKVKKIMRDDDGVVTQTAKAALKKELGDVLWYVSELSRQLGFTLEEVAWANIVKLQQRSEAGMIGGSGDDREDHWFDGVED